MFPDRTFFIQQPDGTEVPIGFHQNKIEEIPEELCADINLIGYKCLGKGSFGIVWSVQGVGYLNEKREVSKIQSILRTKANFVEL